MNEGKNRENVQQLEIPRFKLGLNNEFVKIFFSSFHILRLIHFPRPIFAIIIHSTHYQTSHWLEPTFNFGNLRNLQITNL